MLWLVRHGESEANRSRLLVGRMDSPLTALGRRQAEALGDLFARQRSRPVRLVTSPLGRAVDTAQAIYEALAAADGGGRVACVEVDERFSELDYGELDGCSSADLEPGTWERWRADSSWRPPQGETLEEVGSRVSAACAELAPVAAGGDVIVTSHVSPIKAAVAWALGGGADLSWRLLLGVASVTRVATYGDGGRVLVSFNETGHLDGL
jgi:broad specificity phosphatase PhoE